jgi:osmoprotectant transport system substrate-binding protein
MQHARRWLAWASIGVAALAACGSDEGRPATATALGDDAITVGSFAFPESVLLAEIYSQALEAGGFRVERALGLGPREFAGPALSVGLIEFLPEYAGTALTVRSLGTAEPSADPAATHRDLERALEGTEVTALASAPAQNANTFVVTTATAIRYDLQRLSDLAPIAGELTFGGPPECPTRALCLLGLQERYGLRFGDVITTLDASGPITHEALRTGGVDIALMFSTDPTLAEFIELADDRELQPAENVTPLVRREVVERWGQSVVDLIDGVSAQLDTVALRRLNASAAGGDVATVAAAWLRSEGLT